MAIDRIQGSNSIAYPEKLDKVKPPQAAQGQHSTASSASIDEVNAILAEAKQLARHEPMDEAKVQAVRDAILSGQYRIDTLKIAKRILGYD